MLVKQLFEETSCTYTYLLGCTDTGQGVLIDPTLETVHRDLQVLRQLGLKLAYTLDTHIHADHLTGAQQLRALTSCKIAGAAMDDLPCRDIGVREGETFRVGKVQIHPLFTPGHTATHHVFLLDDGTRKRVFSGDSLLIDGCGRTDFQGGDAAVLYDSIQRKLFSLPDDTLVYPGHDYEGRSWTTVGREKHHNPRLGKSRSKQEFLRIMAELALPFPQQLEYAVPGNEQCGQRPDDWPPQMRKPSAMHDQG